MFGVIQELAANKRSRLSSEAAFLFYYLIPEEVEFNLRDLSTREGTRKLVLTA